MRVFISILLASAFLLQSTSKLLILANYEINKEYIAKKLCENKAKPKMKCNGKCHLKKQLAKQEKKENSPANNFKTKLDIQFFFENKSFIGTEKNMKKAQDNFTYLFSTSDLHLLPIFHPPTV